MTACYSAFLRVGITTKKMTDAGIKRLILVTALEAEVQGMIAENKKREDEGLAQAYGNEQFVYMAEQMREIANMHDDQVMGVVL